MVSISRQGLSRKDAKFLGKCLDSGYREICVEASKTKIQKGHDMSKSPSVQVQVIDTVPMISSFEIAKHFKYQHIRIKRMIESLGVPSNDKEISPYTSVARSFIDSRGKTVHEVLICRNMFMLLLSRLRGKGFNSLKKEVILAFHKIESDLLVKIKEVQNLQEENERLKEELTRLEDHATFGKKILPKSKRQCFVPKHLDNGCIDLGLKPFDQTTKEERLVGNTLWLHKKICELNEKLQRQKHCLDRSILIPNRSTTLRLLGE